MVIDIHDPAVKRTFVLMVPVTIGLGLININASIDQLFATHYLNPNLAPAAIVRAFRLYMLPQGVFSVAVATVLFPLLSRHASREDWSAFKRTVAYRAPADLASCSCRPAWRRRCSRRRSCGSSTSTSTSRLADTPIVAACLAAFALGLTFNGTMLMLNRGFFSLQSPWIPSWVAFGNLGLNALLDAVFYRFGIWGIPLSTSLVNIAGTGALLVLLPAADGRVRARGDGAGLRPRVRRLSGAGRGRVGGLAPARRGARPTRYPAQIVSLGAGLLLGYAAFFGVCRLLGVRELETLLRLRRSRA